MSMRDYLVNGLRENGVEITSDLRPLHASTIVTFAMGSPERTGAFVQAAVKNQISLTYRGGWVRSAVHFWNDESDIDRLLDVIETFGLE